MAPDGVPTDSSPGDKIDDTGNVLPVSYPRIADIIYPDNSIHIQCKQVFAARRDIIDACLYITEIARDNDAVRNFIHFDIRECQFGQQMIA